MRTFLALALLTCAACSQDDAPADEVAAAAEEILDPAAQPTPLAKGPWAPRDECAEVEGAAAFRERLAAAVEARDADALVALAADDIELDFGGGAGAAELRSRLADDDRGLWDELDALMALGCAANEQGGVTIPWYFAQDYDFDDPTSTVLVAAEDVPVLTEPRSSARTIATVSWDWLEWSMVPFEAEREFQQVRLADGGVGYVPIDKVRTLMDYRLIASSRNGRWRITALIAGD